MAARSACYGPCGRHERGRRRRRPTQRHPGKTSASRIFDPFFSTKGEGTGLGLAITRQIVEAHGGSIVVAPREGGGTSFRLLLPIAPPRTSGPQSVPSKREGVV